MRVVMRNPHEVVMRNPHEDIEYGGGGRYTEIDPPTRLAFTWLWDGNTTRQLIELARAFDNLGRTLDQAHPHKVAQSFCCSREAESRRVGWLRLSDVPAAKHRPQSGYSSLRQARNPAGSLFGVRLSSMELYGATNGSGADTV